MAFPESQGTEIFFMCCITICFAISWVYLLKTRELPTPASTHFFLVLQLLIVVALIIYYSLYKFAKFDDNTFNWIICGTGFGAVIVFVMAFIGGWYSNKSEVLGLRSSRASS
jgi:hypothetical protein